MKLKVCESRFTPFNIDFIVPRQTDFAATRRDMVP